MKKFTGIITVIISAGLVLTGPGCRTVEPPESPAVEWTPPDWAREEQAAELVWDSIRKKPHDFSQPLSLADCIDLALKNSPVTRQSWAAARAAAAEVGQAESYLYPQVSVSGDGTYLKQDYSMKDDVPAVDVPSTDGFYYGPGLNLNWLLYDFGGVSEGIEEARQTLLAIDYSFNQSIQDLILNVEKSYGELYSAHSEVKAGEADVKDTSKALEAASQKFEVGLVSKLDKLQAQSTYQDSLYRLESAKGYVKSAHAALADALGIPADTEFDIAKLDRKLPTEVSTEDVSRLIEEGLKNRPDIASLRAQLRAKEAAIRVAGAAYYPSLNLGGSANKLWYSYREDPELYDDSYMYTGYLSLNWDIFTGFSDWEKKREAEALAAQARESLAAGELSASADVWTKHYAFNTAVRKYTFSQAYLDTSRESYNLAQESYDAGLKSILDLLQSQSDLSSARSQLIRSRKKVFDALAELAHATGTLGIKDIEGRAAGSQGTAAK
ncbi:MAG: TolC family protein [Candidatus Euphemobacter frigidus]|nr:TolC family protein [Candidatus Euphemobacter frigidus]